MHNTVDSVKTGRKGGAKIWFVLGCGLLAAVAGVTIQKGYWPGTAEAADTAGQEAASPAKTLQAESIPGGGNDTVSPVKAVTYTCSMHPQIVSDKPGDCPICGMYLEPIKQ